MRLIDADQITDHEIIDYLGIKYASCLEDIRELLNDQPTIKAVPLSEIYRLVAGHSNYLGDAILAATSCITEGKKVKPIRPIEVVPVVQGKWIYENYTWHCGKCGFHPFKGYIPETPGFNFCPNCGVEMKGGAE